MASVLWGFTLFCLVFVLIHIGYILWNLWEYTRWLRVSRTPNTQRKRDIRNRPFFSVLIPARNEEDMIEECVRSVLANPYPRFEVIVLDDQSTDQTFSIIQETRDPRLKPMTGKPLPKGWVGKNWACHQLAQEASGDFFVFIDADTRISEDNLEKLSELISLTQADFISGFPTQIMKSLGAGLTVPYMSWLIFGIVPIRLIPKNRWWFSVASIGQYMAISKPLYNRVGGHEQIRNRIVDDFHLPLEAKKRGGKVVFTYIAHMIQTHMYQNYRDAFRGFSKNAFATMGYSIPLMLLTIFGLFLYQISPWILLGYHIQNGIYWIPMIVAFGSWLSRILTDRMIRTPWKFSLVAPLGYFAMLPIFIASFRGRKTHLTWKGRPVDHSKE